MPYCSCHFLFDNNGLLECPDITIINQCLSPVQFLFSETGPVQTSQNWEPRFRIQKQRFHVVSVGCPAGWYVSPVSMFSLAIYPLDFHTYLKLPSIGRRKMKRSIFSFGNFCIDTQSQSGNIGLNIDNTIRSKNPKVTILNQIGNNAVQKRENN